MPIGTGRQFLLGIIGELHRDVQTHLTRSMKGPHVQRCNSLLKSLFDYTMGDGKCARSQLVLNTYQTLKPDTNEKEFRNAAKVAASVEVLQSFFLIMDDIVDQSHLRRGKPCWHTLPDVGLRANIDGLVLESSVDLIVRLALRDHPQKHAVIDNFAETKAKTAIGQELDIMTSDIGDFNWPLYRDIVEHKTSHYTYFSPLLLGFQLADVSVDVAALQRIAYKIGYLFQAQDDFLDAFGDPAVMGKSSNDFAESKCTWLMCRLLEKIGADSTKMRLFRQHFASAKADDIDAVRAILSAERVDSDFQAFQTQFVEELRAEIAQFPVRELRAVLAGSVDSIVNRKK